VSQIYGADLASIHACGFAELALAALAVLVPRLKSRSARRIIDVGCGAGVSTRALIDAGFEVLAIERSAALLNLAQKAAPGARFLLGSAYDVMLEPCDAILAIGEVLTYHAPEEDADACLRSFFGAAAAALPKGGQLVFDMIETGDALLSARAWKAGPDWAVLSASNEDVESRRITREIETFREVSAGCYRRSRETHHVRTFERATIDAWLEQVGFDVETATAYGDFELPRRRVVFYATRI
jgi:SAM-dependent methyltransferase